MKFSRIEFDPFTIKQQIDPYDFYVREQGLVRPKHSSNKWMTVGLCPFHSDRSEGSFSINLKSGGFHCFSCNAKGGDIISFTQQKYQLGFKQALEKLISEWGVR